MPTRRQILAAIAALPLAGVAFPSWATTGTERRLVIVILRGAMDGLAAVPAYGDPHFAALRGALNLGNPGAAGGALELDGMFGLHPSLAGLHDLYGRGEMAVIHSAATPYRDRSHFSGQDTLENGTLSATGARDGWLARALPPGHPEAAIAISESIPYLLRGPAQVTAWTPSRHRPVDDDTMERLQLLYAEDRRLSGVLDEALEAEELAGNAAGPGGRKQDRFSQQMGAAAHFLTQPSGPRIAVVNSIGWDTHLSQNSRLARLFASLDAGLATLRTGLGDAWLRTAVLVVTEFGRTVAVNGTGGTDHGTGGVSFLLGGAVNGGRVVADWPGLSQASLLDGRDLRPTTDVRAAAKGILGDHLAVPSAALDTVIFPGSETLKPLQGLIRG